MSNHDDDTCPHLVRANLLESENARLRSFCTRTIIPNIDLEKEVTRLKAEVERLTAVFVPENLILRADVERLTKAGDAVCESPYLLETDPAVISWRAATEGNKP
jgi:hypothetical protein